MVQVQVQGEVKQMTLRNVAQLCCNMTRRYGKPIAFDNLGTANFVWYDTDHETVKEELLVAETPVEAVRDAYRSICTRCGGCGIYYWGTIVNGVPSYSGTCFRCNGSGVEPSYTKSIEPAPEVKTAAQNMADGTYTIEMEDDHFTFRVKTLTEGNLAGKTLVEYLAGPDNTTDFRGFAFMADGKVRVWGKFTGETMKKRAGMIENVADAEKAGEMYALVSGRCRRCNRTLTVPASIHRGYGPDCAEKVGL